MRILSLFALVLFVVSIMACGSTPPEVDPELEALDIPVWFTSPPTDPNYLFEPSTATSRDMQLAVDKCKTSARTGLAEQYQVKVQGLKKRFREEVGLNEDSELLESFTAVEKSVVSEVMNGTRVKEQKISVENGLFRAYILMEYPIGKANALLMEKMKSNQNLYTRFRASQAFEDLDKEMKDYEEFQKDQGMIR